MSLSSLNTISDSLEMNCPICQDDYDEQTKSPKLLPCHHSVCLNCLTQLELTNGRITCPICTQEGAVPQGGVQAFQTNFYLLPLLSSRNSDSTMDTANQEMEQTEQKSQQPFQIFVKTLTGSLITVNDVKQTDTVRSIKEKISVKTGVPADPQRLIHMGKQLADHQTVANARIQPLHTIHLTLRLLGGLTPV